MRMRYALVIYVLLACVTGSSRAQEQAATVARTVQLDAIPADAPFQIAKVMLNGIEIKPGIPFPAGDDCFNRLQVVIKNASQKNIVYAMGQLRFPETGDATAEHLAVMDRISVGRRPEHARSADSSSRRSAAGLQPHIDGAEILVRPGQEITVPVVDDFDAIKAGIEARRPLSGVTICEIGFHTLYFDDGTSWL